MIIRNKRPNVPAQAILSPAFLLPSRFDWYYAKIFVCATHMHNSGDIPLQLTVMMVRDGINFQDRTILKFSVSRALRSRIRGDGIWHLKLQSRPVREDLRSDVLNSIRLYIRELRT